MGNRAAIVLTVVGFAASCQPSQVPSLVDGLAQFDGGFIFAETLASSICFSPSGRKFIMDLHAPNGPFTCAAFSFRHSDAGVPALFPAFKAPPGYVLDDARYSSFCDFEQPDGIFSEVRTARVDDLWGAMEFRGFFQGMPRAFFLSGDTVMRLGNLLYVADEGVYSTLGVCKGE
jgi:hypothetical protein